jgi:hypothetical protein
LKSTPEAKYESIEHDQAMKIHPTLATQNSASNWNASECRRAQIEVRCAIPTSVILGPTKQ